MRFGSWKPLNSLRGLMRQEDGQDIVEYALLAGMIGLGVTAGVRSIAEVRLTAFDTFTAALSSNIT